MIDVHGFVGKESDLSPVYRVGDTMRSNQRADEQQKRYEQNQKEANSKYLQNQYDPKEYLTGSNFDKVTIGLVEDALKTAQELNAKGLNLDQINMAVYPLVSKANRYVSSGKRYAEQKKQALSMAAKMPHIDLDKFASQMDAMAFPTDPNTGQIDVDKYNPEFNYADEVTRNGDIYNSKGFDELLKASGKNEYSKKLKLINGRGGYENKDVTISSPSFMIPDTDERGNHIGFVPEYDIATSYGEHVSHDWDTPNGKKTAPVRMIKDSLYENTLTPESKAFLLQEGRRYAGIHGLDVNDPEVYNFKKALAYTQLSGSHKLSSSFKENQVIKKDPIKVYNINRNVDKPTQKDIALGKKFDNLKKSLDDVVPDKEGNKDVTDLLAGINVVSPVNKQPLKFTSIKFNPATKDFYFSTSNGIQKIPLYKLHSLADTGNSGLDNEWLEGFDKYNAQKPAGGNNKSVKLPGE